MFPEFEVNIEEIATPSTDKLGKVFLFNHKQGRHVLRDGKLVEATELEAVKQWIELLLKTQIDKYKIYQDTYFGLSTTELVGKKEYPIMILQSMIEQEIKEKATEHILIKSILGFKIDRTDRGLTISFKVVLKNGNTQGVTIDAS